MKQKSIISSLTAMIKLRLMTVFNIQEAWFDPFDYFHCPVILLASNSAIQDINQAALDAYGWKKQEVLGKNLVMLLKENKFKNILLKNQSFVLNFPEKKNLTKNLITTVKIRGKRMVIRWKITPLFNNDNSFKGTLLIGNDISFQRKLEVKNDELKKAKEEAENATRAKIEFLKNMSHDVKTPLAGIIAFSELLNAKVQSELLPFTQSLIEASKQLMTFFENCIELSKLENNALTNSQDSFSLDELLRELRGLFQPTAMAKDLVLLIESASDLPSRVMGNRANLYRVLLNLLGNAMKFTDKGSIKLRAELMPKSTPDIAIVALTIVDTGIGIPEDKQNDIFEKYARATSVDEINYEGHGIGLFIVREFVASMGGSIECSSQKGVGSQFKVIVPLKRVEMTEKKIPALHPEPAGLEKKQTQALGQVVPSEAPKEKQASIQVSTRHDRNQPTILYVEDNLMAQTSGTMVLNFVNCHVDIAENGEKAIALFEPGKYALIFMDLSLPDITGYEVAKQFRAMEKNTGFHATILGLSAHISQEQIELGAEAEMEEMFAKPLLLASTTQILQDYGLISAHEPVTTGI